MNTRARRIICIATASILGATLTACDKHESQSAATPTEPAAPDHPDQNAHMETTHGHEETPLGTAQVGDLTVECAQGHGAVAPGKEMHLIVKLPYSDQGATVVRAWIGTEDRMLSRVAKGEYAASHDDYDIHAEAPNPLPEGAQWWIEIEGPDGAKQVGSCRIL